jgi:hypothetical protein
MQRFKSLEPTRSTFPPLMRSFTAIFIHADTDWRLPLIARSAPRPSVCGGRRRVSSVRHNLPYILGLPLRGSPQIDHDNARRNADASGCAGESGATA